MAEREPVPAVEIRGVSKAFGGIRAVDDCSIAVAPGSITGLIGPNGAGKSTLFAIVTGFLRPDRGSILVGGVDVTATKPHERVRLGMARTFQIAHELSRMTVLENLMVVPHQPLGESLLAAWFRWGRIRQEEAAVRRRAEEVLDFLHLAPLAGEYAGNLSGGQKKLLELGRVMMLDARVVLLDELAAGVNRTLLAVLAGHIERLNRELGYTFCVIEHDMGLIERLCDPVIVMAEGRVLKRGSMAEIKRDPEVIEAYLGGGMRSLEARA